MNQPGLSLKTHFSAGNAVDEGEARSLINASSPSGLNLTVKKADGSTLDLSVKDGPVYPTLDDDIPLD